MTPDPDVESLLALAEEGLRSLGLAESTIATEGLLLTRCRAQPTIWACRPENRSHAAPAEARARHLTSNGTRCTVTVVDRYDRLLVRCTFNGPACCSHRAEKRNERRDSGRRWMKTQGQVTRSCQSGRKVRFRAASLSPLSTQSGYRSCGGNGACGALS